MKIISLTLLLMFSPFILNAKGNFKACEKIVLSKFTTLVSCHQLDYLIEYKYNDDEEKDNIKKITIISKKDEKIIIKKVENK